MFGATGFTGKLAATYLAKQYGTKGGFSWAIAGRTRSALEKLKSDLIKVNSDVSSLDIIIGRVSV